MNLIAHVEIPVLDIERAMRFYHAVFGVNFGEIVTIHGNQMAFFPFAADQNGASGALAQGNVYVPTRDGAIIYIGVSDIDEVLAKAVALGSEVLFPKTLAGENIYVAEIADSEGNRIAIQGV
ncbi:glyoxalase [Niveispirillum lacus]|uniref:Glyoxalase n=1 Tax=Niveispirillum lacus TaxID=1981099 RepID=A0A255Z2M9_9PROT|nr:VOC family protein [Niveispirillum lacus]OYQ34910.1 glyoxalase [Niveispirillum lacus]